MKQQSLTFTLILSILALVPAFAHAQTPCQQPLTPPAQYGSATHAALNNNQQATTATCTPEEVTITTNPIPDQTQLYFNTGYILQNSNWVPLNFKGGTPFKDSSGASHKTWLTGKASATAPITTTSKATYYLFFSCTYADSRWKCGCRDGTCETPYWQIAKFQPTQSSGSNYASAKRYEDFETGTYEQKLSQGILTEQGGCYPHSFAIVPDPAGSGKAFRTNQKGNMKSICKKNSEDKHRTEVGFYGARDEKFPHGSDFWFGMKMYIGEDYEATPSEGVIVVQTIASDYVAVKGHPNIMFIIKGDQIYFNIMGTDKTLQQKIGTTDMPKGQWVDWKVHQKISTGSDGSVTIWKNGEQIVSYQGQSTRGEFDQYMKFGPYWGTDNRGDKDFAVYYDDIWVSPSDPSK
jgi:hypothetical protein